MSRAHRKIRIVQCLTMLCIFTFTASFAGIITVEDIEETRDGKRAVNGKLQTIIGYFFLLNFLSLFISSLLLLWKIRLYNKEC